MVTPGSFVSTIRMEIPLCLSALGSELGGHFHVFVEGTCRSIVAERARRLNGHTGELRVDHQDGDPLVLVRLGVRARRALSRLRRRYLPFDCRRACASVEWSHRGASCRPSGWRSPCACPPWGPSSAGTFTSS